MKVAWFTPLYPPARGGAASYVELLAPRLSGDADLLVVTERHAGKPLLERVEGPGWAYRVLRVLPRYSDRAHKGRLSSIACLIANRAALLPVMLALRICAGVRLFHCHGQFARFGMGRILVLFSHVIGTRCLLDIRDHRVRGSFLRTYDGVIVASRNIEATVRGMVDPARLHHIPVPLGACAQSTVSDVRLPVRFFLYVGEISVGKGVDILLEAYRRYRGEHRGDAAMLLIGPGKEPLLIRESGAIALGPQPTAVVADAIRRSLLLLLPSRSEGMPRVCLEAIREGARFVVGPGVLEFAAACPENVLPELSASAILRCLEDPESVPRPTRYDLASHDPIAVALATLRLYRLLASERAAEAGEDPVLAARGPATVSDRESAQKDAI